MAVIVLLSKICCSCKSLVSSRNQGFFCVRKRYGSTNEPVVKINHQVILNLIQDLQRMLW